MTLAFMFKLFIYQYIRHARFILYIYTYIANLKLEATNWWCSHIPKQLDIDRNPMKNGVNSYPPAAGPPCSTWSPAASRPTWLDTLDASVLEMERTEGCFVKIEGDDRLDYRLPKKGSLAGAVLKHCFKVIDTTIEKHTPLTFKLGFTHCPHTRMYNQRFGYRKDAWENMLVLYVACESISPAFVEAALIQKYKGPWDLYIYINLLLISLLPAILCAYKSLRDWFTMYQCPKRNIYLKGVNKRQWETTRHFVQDKLGVTTSEMVAIQSLQGTLRWDLFLSTWCTGHSRDQAMLT